MKILKILSLSLIFTTLGAQAAEYSAKNCEIFVDAIEITRGSHSLTVFYPKVKTLNERLDSPISKVSIYAIRHTVWNNSGNTPGYMDNGAFEIQMSPFFGAKDYWTTGQGLTLGHDWGAWYYEFTVYVETTRGTRYFANAANGGNFWASSEEVRKLLGASGGLWSGLTTLSTHEGYGLTFNPQGCR